MHRLQLITTTFTMLISFAFVATALAQSPDQTAGQGVPETNANPPLSHNGMQVYLGDLHSHTGYSDGAGTPAQAFAAAKAAGIDFFAITEHGFMLTPVEWQDLHHQAELATVPGQFVGLPAFEYTHKDGHLNVFNTPTYVSRDNPRYDTLTEFYGWLAGQPDAVGQFNHPFPNFNFNNFLPYNTAADKKISLRETTTVDQYFLGLNQGWQISTVKNSDTHSANWGCCPNMGVLAPELSQPAIIGALQAGRTFVLSPHDPNLAVSIQANGHWMGSTITGTNSLNIVVNTYDPDPTGGNLNVLLYDKATPIASTSLQSRLIYTFTTTIPATPGHYYFAAVYYDGWAPQPAFSSPVFVE